MRKDKWENIEEERQDIFLCHLLSMLFLKLSYVGVSDL